MQIAQLDALYFSNNYLIIPLKHLEINLGAFFDLKINYFYVFLSNKSKNNWELNTLIL